MKGIAADNANISVNNIRLIQEKLRVERKCILERKKNEDFSFKRNKLKSF